MPETIIFSYRHVKEVPLCPCMDPGNYAMLVQVGNDPLACELRCWCGGTLGLKFESREERDAFIVLNAKKE